MISIVILTYNRAAVLCDLIKSIYSIPYNPMEIIVVDNHSEDNTYQMVRDHYPRCTYIRTEKNIGVGARNLGLKKASGEFVICLDDDIFGIDFEAIQKIVNKFREDDNIGAINFKVINYYSGELCNWVHHCEQEKYSNRTFLTYEITEGAVAFRKDALKYTGYYPEYFFLSHEGLDLALRLMDNDYSVIYFGEVEVKHRYSELGRKPWYNYYYDTRNHIWLAARNFPIYYMIPYLGRSLLSTLTYSIRDGFFKYWLKAVWDGLKELKHVANERTVLKKETMIKVKEIDSMRLPFIYMLKKRLLANSMKF